MSICYPYSRVQAGQAPLPYGLSEEQRVGDISASSTTFTITSPPHANLMYSTFRAGDEVIVEIGGETGAGVIGTEGVGGSLPATDGGEYYRALKSPRALKTSIVSVSANGQTLVLQDPAVVSTTGANIYFDCSTIILGLLAEVHAEPYTLTFPAGKFAVSTRLLHDFQSGWTIQGAGQNETIFFSPRGVASASMTFYDSDRMTYRDFQIKGNWNPNGFGLATFPPTFFPSDVPAGMHGSTTSDSLYERVKCIDIGMKGGWFDFAIDCTARDCTTVLNEVHREYYSAWYYGCGDSTDCTFENCRVESPYLTVGFETFRSSGAIFTNCVGINAVFSSNSSGDFRFEDCHITIEADSFFDTASFTASNPIYNINSNIDPPDATMLLGGNIVNCGLTVEGSIGNVNDDYLKGIVVNVDNPNIRITGGTYSYPNGMSGQEHGPFAIVSTGENCDVTNVTCVGAVVSPAFQANVNLSNAGDPGSISSVVGSVIINGVVIQ